MLIYESYLYYSYIFGEKDAPMVYRVDKNGGEPQVLAYGDYAILVTVADDLIYYYDDDGYIYRANLNFSEIETLYQIKNSDNYGFYTDGKWLYFYGNPIISELYENEYTSYSLFRVKIGSKKEPQDILSGLMATNRTTLENNRLYLLSFSPLQYDTDTSNLKMPDNIYTGTHIIELDLSTLKLKDIYNTEDFVFGQIYSVTNDFIIAGGEQFQENANSKLKRIIIIYNITDKTLEIITV